MQQQQLPTSTDQPHPVHTSTQQVSEYSGNSFIELI